MKRIIGFSISILAVALFSCQNDNVDIPIDEGLSEKSAQITLTEIKLEAAATEVEYEVEFYANAEETITRWWNMGRMWKWSNKLRYKVNQCPDIHIQSEPGGYPKTITLNYGDSTVLRNGKVLSGIIVIEISGPKRSRDYNCMVSYDDFGIDSLLIEGSSLITVDKNEDVFRRFESDFLFTMNRNSERVWEWIEGMETDDEQNDDVIQITGFVNAQNSAGDIYKKEIVEPLIRLRDCRYIVKGIVEITLNGVLISSLDYGNGECNNIAILTKDGETFEVDLSKGNMNKMPDSSQDGNQNGNG